MTSTPNAKTKYMGTATTTNNVAPTTPSSYTWTLVKGADGKNGEQGVAGAMVVRLIYTLNTLMMVKHLQQITVRN